LAGNSGSAALIVEMTKHIFIQRSTDESCGDDECEDTADDGDNRK
jgi:hypothetical protein